MNWRFSGLRWSATSNAVIGGMDSYVWIIQVEECGEFSVDPSSPTLIKAAQDMGLPKDTPNYALDGFPSLAEAKKFCEAAEAEILRRTNESERLR